MLNGNILDVYPDHKKDVMVTWLIDGDGAKKVEKKYEPSFYVYTNSADLYRLASIYMVYHKLNHLILPMKK